MPGSPSCRTSPRRRGPPAAALFVLWGLLALQPCVAAAGGVSFQSKFVGHPTAIPPGDVVAGDFDEDGRNEIALVKGVTGAPASIHMFRAEGSRWVPLPALTTGLGPYALLTMDLDGDGHLDIATANYSSSSVSVLRGLGNGSFQPRVSYSTASGPRSIAAGDITGDGVLDLVTASTAAPTISVLAGNGAGGYLARADRSSGTDLRGVRLHDFDGDGLADVVVVSRSGNSLLLHRSLGGGLLDVAQTYSGLSLPEDLALGDFDQDGRMDVVVVQGGAASLLYFRGGAGLGLEAPIAIPIPGDGIRVAAGQADSDGFLDLLATVGTNLVLLRGRGDGSFEPSQIAPAGTGASEVLLAELDGDPFVEIAVGCTGNNKFAVYDMTDAGLLGSVDAADEYPGSLDLHLVDYDIDGALDLVQLTPGTLETRRGLGGGAFAAPVVVATGLTPWGYQTGFVALGEFNGDGIQDIVGVRNILDNDLEAVVFHGNGTTANGGFDSDPQPLGVVSTHAFSSGGVASVAVGDVNQDGRDDILVGRYSSEPHVIVFRQLTGGDFVRTDLTLPDYQHAAIGAIRMVVTDVNGDSEPDILIATPVQVAYMLGLGNGVLGTALYVDGSPGNNADFETFADVDADGWMDVLSTNDGLASWRRGTGAGTFGPIAATFMLPGPSRGLQAHDVDHDGWLDVLAPIPSAGCVSVFRARGDGTFEAPRLLGAANGAAALAVDDLDGDGWPEILVGGTGSTVVLRNQTALVDVPAPRPVLPALALSSSFPNPMRVLARFDLSLPDARSAEFQVVDVRGRIVHRMPLDSGVSGTRRIEVRLPGRLPAGLYFGRLVHPLGSRSTKFVLQR